MTKKLRPKLTGVDFDVALKEVTTNIEGPYWDATLPEHDEAVDFVLAYYRLADALTAYRRRVASCKRRNAAVRRAIIRRIDAKIKAKGAKP